MMRLPLVVSLGLLFAWSAPWTCQTYSLPDGGSTIFDKPGSTTGGSPGAFNVDSGSPIVFSGGTGLAAGADGGVTIGSAAAFNSNFVYMANANDGTVSRIVLPPDGGVPFEEARYYAIVPVDNHGLEPCVGNVCTKVAGATTNDIWHVERSYIFMPTYTIDSCYADGGYTILTSIPYNDGGYMILTAIFYNDGGYTLPGDGGYFNDGGYSVGYNDGGYTRDAGTAEYDGGYAIPSDGGVFNDGGYSHSYNDGGYDRDAGLPYNDGGYAVVVSLPFNDGGYTSIVSVPFNDGGYSVSYNDGGHNYFLDSGVELRDGSGVYSLLYNDAGYSEDSGVAYNDGGYSEDAGQSRNDGGYTQPGDGGYFNDGGYSLSYNDGGYERDAGIPENDGGWTLWTGILFNDGGYTKTYNDAGYDRAGNLPYNDGGYSIPTNVPYNDAGYILPTNVPYNDGGYCIMLPYSDGGSPRNDGGAIDQLNTAYGADNQPSRTVIDRNGNVWVVLRATDGTNFFQSGATKIIDVDDHLSQCAPRCIQRQGLMPNQAFTEGVSLALFDGGSVTLRPPGIIAPGSVYATSYACLDNAHDHTGTIETDAVNYDDCIRESIPLGAPYPDPNADPRGLTNGLNFGRAAAIAPNCDPSTQDCDVWVGMWNGAGWIRLSYNGAGTGIPFDVGSVIYPGASPYGAAIDCAGIIWGTGNNAFGADVLTATSTVAVTDPATLVSVPPYTVMTNFAINNAGSISYQYGIPKPSTNYHYGISSDISENIWSAAGEGGPLASAFSGKKLFTMLAGVDAGYVSQSLFQQGLNLGWSTYDFSNIAPGPSLQPFGNVAGNGAAYARGINVDRYSNVYVGIDLYPWQEGGQGVVAFQQSSDGGTIPCYLYDGGSCPSAKLNWAYGLVDAGGHGGSVGVDIDAQGNPWVGNYGQPQGLAVQFSAYDGGILNQIPVGNGTYSYSDFTGYALRYITLQRAVYQQSIPGCGVSPELTQWNSLAYTADLPTGTDLQIDVRVTNSLTPAVIANATDYTVCDSVTHPATGTSCPRNPDQSINLSYFNLPQGYYLTVFVTLSPSICGGGSTQANDPTLYKLSTGQSCSGN